MPTFNNFILNSYFGHSFTNILLPTSLYVKKHVMDEWKKKK